MSFNPNIPQVTDPILQSSRQIRANFQAINAAFADNHVGLMQNQDFAGMHTVLTMQPQSGDPATAATQVALYNKIVSGIPELFFRPSSSQTPIQLTYPSLSTSPLNTTPQTYPAQQYTFLPGPFVVYGGILIHPAKGTVITLTPVTTLLFVDVIVTSYTGTVVSLADITATNVIGNSFTISYSTDMAGAGTNFNVYYTAIGV